MGETDLPKIVNVRVANLRPTYRDLDAWLKDSNNVYIGRPVKAYPHVKGSKWGNPYPLYQYSLEESLRLYKLHVQNSPHLMAALPELKGKSLGCWCTPSPCHGEVLRDLVADQ